MIARAFRLALPVTLQLTVQGISFVTAFALIRTLSIADFAIYSGFLVLSQAAVSACDLGAVSSIGYFYKRVERNLARFAPYFRAVVQVRSVLFLVVGAVLYPAFLFGSSLGYQVTALPVLIVISVVTSLSQASYGTTATALRFVSATGVVTALGIEMVASVVRLVLIGTIVILAGFATARTVLLITAATAIVQAFVSWRALNRHFSAPSPDEASKPLPRREVARYVMPIIPGGLYHSIQPLLLTWLAAYHGGLREIAEISVLGRIGLIFGVLSFIVSFQLIPALGRAETRAQFMKIYLMSAAGLLALLIFALIVGFLFPSEIMSLAGAKYSGLDSYLPMALASAALTLISGFAVMVLRLEGWNRFEPFCTVIQVVGQALWILLVPIQSTHSLIVFAFFSALLYCLPYVALNVAAMFLPEIFTGKRATT